MADPLRDLPLFPGFPSGKVRLIGVPAPFFTDLLPQIDHLAELKVTLYAIWCLDQQEGEFRTIRESDFAGDARLMNGLGATPEAAAEALRDGLERAVQRGSLLKGTLAQRPQECYYFLNTPRGRAAVQALLEGAWLPDPDLQPPVTMDLERPNIFRLYEQHIGPLTPMIADTLREAERTYPAAWIEDAVRIAVENNVRRWRYIDAILRGWQEEGRDEQHRGDSAKNRRRYVEGEFADFIEH